MSHTSTTVRRARLDRVCAEAVDLARSAAEGAGEGVGAYIGAEPDADRVVSHYFECTLPSYRGWSWVTVLMRAPRSRHVTVAETALLPGSDALIAPQWVPWSDRLRAGDVGVGDLLPTDESDERLMPAYTLSDDDGVEDIAFELGVGRPRVMSREGRAECAERWYEGPQGPNSDISRSAPADARCGTCGFYLQLAGSMRQMFGVCGNVYAADDANVVSADHGCGAHSEVLNRDGDVKPKVVEEGNTLFDDSSVDPVSASGEAVATDEAETETAEVGSGDAPASEAAGTDRRADTGGEAAPQTSSDDAGPQGSEPSVEAVAGAEVTQPSEPERDEASSVDSASRGEQTAVGPQAEGEVTAEPTDAAAEPTESQPVETRAEDATTEPVTSEPVDNAKNSDEPA